MYAMPSPGQTGRQRHSVLNLSICLSVHASIHPFVCYQTFEHAILEMYEPILMPISTSGSRGNGQL